MILKERFLGPQFDVTELDLLRSPNLEAIQGLKISVKMKIHLSFSHAASKSWRS